MVPARRRGPRRGGPAGLAVLRDPPLGASATPGSTTSGPVTNCAAASPRRTATTSARWSSACSCAGCTSSRSRVFGLATVDLYGVFGRLLIAAVPGGRARVLRRLLRPGGALDHEVPVAAAAVVLHLRPVLLVARAPLEGARGVPQPLQRHALQEPDLADAGRPDRQQGLRRRRFDHRADAHHHRGRLHAQRGKQDPVPLAGGRHLQVRPQPRSAPARRSASAPTSTTA